MKKSAIAVGTIGVSTALLIALLYLFLSGIYAIPSVFTNSLAMRILTPSFVSIFGLALYLLILRYMPENDWEQSIGACSLTITFFFIVTIGIGTILNIVSKRKDVPLYGLILSCLFVPVFYIIVSANSQKKKKKTKKKKKKNKTPSPPPSSSSSSSTSLKKKKTKKKKKKNSSEAAETV